MDIEGKIALLYCSAGCSADSAHCSNAVLQQTTCYSTQLKSQKFHSAVAVVPRRRLQGKCASALTTQLDRGDLAILTTTTTTTTTIAPIPFSSSLLHPLIRIICSLYPPPSLSLPHSLVLPSPLLLLLLLNNPSHVVRQNGYEYYTEPRRAP